MSRAQDEQVMVALEEAERLKINCHHTEAIAILEDLLAEDPGNVAALEEVADNELSLENYDRAMNAASQAAALEPESYTAHYILGFIRSLKEDWEKSLEDLQIANQLKPNNPEILRCLGWVLFNAGKRVQGVVTLERALNLDPINTLSLCDLGVCYLHIRKYEKAHDLFRKALVIEPGNERAQECIEAIARLQRVVVE